MKTTTCNGLLPWGSLEATEEALYVPGQAAMDAARLIAQDPLTALAIQNQGHNFELHPSALFPFNPDLQH